MNKKQKTSKSKGTQTIELNRDDNLIQRRSFIAAAASTLPVALVACKTGDQLSTLETTDKALQTATSLALNEDSAGSKRLTDQHADLCK